MKKATKTSKGTKATKNTSATKTKKARKTNKTTTNTKKRRTTSKKRQPAKTFLASALTVIGIGYLVVTAYLYFNQRKFLYFPPEGVLQTAEQTIEIRNGSFTLRGWVVNTPDNNTATASNAIIYFGGNAERPELSIVDFKELFSNQTIYFINYRGYGNSDGTPNEAALYDDAMAIYDYIAPQHNHISVIGRSLGTGVATYLTTQRDIHRLVLVAPYDCITNIAQATYPIFPMQLILKDHYNSAERAPEITTPTLIIMAGNDRVIPANSTEKLIEQFTAITPQVSTIQEATHNTIQDYTQYYLLLRDFMNTQ